MAMETAPPPSAPAAQVVGNAFVEQYYHILHHSPELVYRFYQDLSTLSRQDPSGVMTSVTTMNNINDKICSMDYKNHKAEIKTADAQESYKDGVIVLVTGCLTGQDNLRRKFSQTFFLAPQDKGYFVLNDVFRYIEDNEPATYLDSVNGTDDAPTPSLNPDPETVHVLDPPTVDQATSHTEVIPNGEEQANQQVENDNQVVNVREIVLEGEPHLYDDSNSVEPINSAAQEDGTKKSYASILSSQTRKGTTRKYVPATPQAAPIPTEKQAVVSVTQVSGQEASASTAPSSATELDDKHAHNEVEGHSIYVRNLPLNVTVAQLEEEFRKFGPIKQGGVQVRSNKQQGYCFGFIEFHDLSSMQSAIQASPLSFGGRQAVVEIKRTTTRVGSSRGRFPTGRLGFRNDNFNGGRTNFSGGRDYGRNYFGNRDYSGRGRGQGAQGGESYPQGRGRGGRRGGSSQNAALT